MNDREIMKQGWQRAARTMAEGIGGPFGAVVTKDGEILSISSNSVLADKDPTAHAEINAIREACKILGTHDLSGCEIYATGYPCPMCMSAIIWANINIIHYAATTEDAEEIGFRDEPIYRFLSQQSSSETFSSPVKMIPDMVSRGVVKALYSKYHTSNKEMY